MLIHRIRVTDWKGIRDREARLTTGLNVLVGDNEQGKSSLLAAITIALFWDHTARTPNKRYVTAWTPVDRPTAFPTVELQLSLAGREATLIKVITESKASRKCVLTLHNPAGPETLTGADAEKKLANLLSLERETKDLGHSIQGRSYAFLDNTLPAVVCSALSVSASGQVLPSRRLERVRLTLEREREERLKKTLRLPLRESFLSQTEAGQLYKEWNNLSAQRDRAIQAMARVEQLRREITRLDQEIESLHREQRSLDERVRLIRQRQLAGEKLERQFADQSRQLGELAAEIKRSEARLAEEASLTRQIQQLAVEGNQLRTEAEALDEPIEQWAKQRAEWLDRRSKAEALVDSARKRLTGLSICREIATLQIQLEKTRQDRTALERLQQSAKAAQLAAEAVSRHPTFGQVQNWRRWNDELLALRREATQMLRIDVDWQTPMVVRWSADRQPPTDRSIEAHQSAAFEAVQSLRLEFPGLGSLTVRCGAGELAELLENLDFKTKRLNDALGPVGLAATDLPDGFDQLERLAEARQCAEQASADARKSAMQAESQGGSKEKLVEREMQLEKSLVSLRRQATALAISVAETPDLDALQNEMDNQAEIVADYERSVRDFTRKLDEMVRQLEKFQNTRTNLIERRSQKEAVGNLLNQRLAGLRGESEPASPERLSEARNAMAPIQQALAQLKAERERLGPSVQEEDLVKFEEELTRCGKSLNTKRQLVGELRGQLRSEVGADPAGLADELTEQTSDLNRRLETEERRAGALALLDALLKAERQRTALSVAQPLNERVTPWLTAIRGAPTRLEFDQQQARISRILTEMSGQIVELPFEDLSEGFKQQIAFLVRLTLSRAIAKETGRRQFVALDDPLTETSPQRRPEMFRILEQAANDLQILVATCHQDVFQSLPGAANIIAW